MTGGDSIFGTAVRGLFIRPFIRATSKFRTRTRRGTPFGCVVPTLKVASGEPAKNELCGAQGIAIFKDGVTL